MAEDFICNDVFREELKQEPHHYGEVVFVESILEKGMNVIEVGGHTGVTAIAIGKAVGEAGHVYVFEPVPEYFSILKKNVKKNTMHNITLFNTGLSSTQGRVLFYKHGGGSGVTEADDAEKIEVEMTTLNDFLPNENINCPVDVINMDCEGSELNVLKGGMNILKKDHPAIFSEVHSGYLKQLNQSVNGIVDFLKGLSYQVRPVQVENLDNEMTYEECSHIYAWFEGKSNV